MTRTDQKNLSIINFSVQAAITITLTGLTRKLHFLRKYSVNADS